MIIFISGPLNAGKSTTARELKKMLKKTTILEPDSLRALIEDVRIDEAVPMVLEMAISIIKILHENGFSVIVPYPLSESNQRYMNSRLRGMGKYFFVLSPDINVIKKGRGKRKLTSWEKQRILHHYTINIHNPKFGYKIDNTQKTARAVAKLILQQIEKA